MKISYLFLPSPRFVFHFISMNHSRKTSWEEDRYASPGILDVNNDDEELAGPMMGRRSRDRHENAPLLQERLSMSEDRFSEESGFLEPKMASNKKLPACISYIPRCDMKTKSYLCCFSSKRAFMFTCLAFCVIPMLIFFIGGYIYFSPLSLPDTIPSELYTTSAPRILTLNIFMRPPGVKNNQDDFKDERLDYIIKNILPSYDIITIQEAFSYGNRRIDTLARAAFDQGFYYQEASPRHYPWELAGDGGLLLLSRLPIRRADRVEFPRGVHADWYVPQTNVLSLGICYVTDY
jgi:hypothetical protein